MLLYLCDLQVPNVFANGSICCCAALVFMLWLGAAVLPEDRNSSGARRYIWLTSGQLVSEAFYPHAQRRLGLGDEQTCLFWRRNYTVNAMPQYAVHEASCTSENVVARMLCEAVDDLPEY